MFPPLNHPIRGRSITDYPVGRTGDREAEPEHHGRMSAARPLPELGSIFLDARGGERALRVSWHAEADLVVLSLWRDNLCVGSFRIAVDEVPDLVEVLRAGLDRTYRHAPTRQPA